MPKTDLRIIKTQKAILSALNTLLETKPVAKITVTELATLAEINKATFYLHYTDIFDLYQFALSQHLKAIAAQLTFMNEFIESPAQFADHLIDLSFTQSLFSNDRYLTKDNAPYNQIGMRAFSDALTDAVLATGEPQDLPATRMRLRFIFSGIGTLLRYHQAEDTATLKQILVTSIQSQFPQNATR